MVEGRLEAFVEKLGHHERQAALKAQQQTIDAALYAFAVTVKDHTTRVVFIQDFAAALGRRNLLSAEETEAFWDEAMAKMEAAFGKIQLLNAVT